MFNTILQHVLLGAAREIDKAINSKLSDNKYRDIYTYKFKCPECKNEWYLADIPDFHICDCKTPIYFNFLSHEGENVNFCLAHNRLFINKNYFFKPKAPCCGTKDTQKAVKVILKKF